MQTNVWGQLEVNIDIRLQCTIVKPLYSLPKPGLVLSWKPKHTDRRVRPTNVRSRIYPTSDELNQFFFFSPLSNIIFRIVPARTTLWHFYVLFCNFMIDRKNTVVNTGRVCVCVRVIYASRSPAFARICFSGLETYAIHQISIMAVRSPPGRKIIFIIHILYEYLQKKKLITDNNNIVKKTIVMLFLAIYTRCDQKTPGLKLYLR